MSEIYLGKDIHEFEEIFGNIPLQDLDKIRDYIKRDYISKDKIREFIKRLNEIIEKKSENNLDTAIIYYYQRCVLEKVLEED